MSNPKLIQKGILAFSLSEIVLGGLTFITTFSTALTGLSQKPVNVMLFVLLSSTISFSLGIGLLCRRHYARKFMVFFSGWIIMSKILVFTGIIALNGALVPADSVVLINTISIIYHAAALAFFHHPRIKAVFPS